MLFFFSIIPPLPQNIVADRKQIFPSLFNIARGGGGGGGQGLLFKPFSGILTLMISLSSVRGCHVQHVIASQLILPLQGKVTFIQTLAV